MNFSQYRFKFYLNASHSILIDGQLGQTHPHTWEMNITTLKTKNSFISFNTFEQRIENILAPYRDVLINEIPPFDAVNPTLENIAHFFKDIIQKEIAANGWLLLSLELAETPTRSYIINLSDEIDQALLEDSPVRTSSMDEELNQRFEAMKQSTDNQTAKTR